MYVYYMQYILMVYFWVVLNLDIVYIDVSDNNYSQELIIKKESEESIQFSQYPVQTHCVKFVL